MGLLKKIIGGVTRSTKNTGFSERAIRKAEKIEHGEKVPPPKYPSTEKAFEEAQHDENIRQDLSKKHEKLIDNAAKITIKSHDPPGKEDDLKNILHEGQPYEHEEEQRWMYGFYEPPPEKMDKNKLNFREVLEILRARLEVSGEGISATGAAGPKADDAQKFLDSHPGVKRVDKEKLDTMFKYFRPFVRREEQFIVRSDDIKELVDILEDRRDMMEQVRAEMLEDLQDMNFVQKAKKMEVGVGDRQSEIGLSDEDKENLSEALEMRRRQEAEFQRLHQRLYEMRKLDEAAKAGRSEDPEAKDTKQRSDEPPGKSTPG